MTRSDPISPGRAMTAEMATGFIAAPRERAIAEEARAADLARRELSRLTALLRRHFSQDVCESLLPLLTDTNDPASIQAARAFLSEIRALAEALEDSAPRWMGSPSIVGALADFRREALSLLAGVEQRLAETEVIS